MVCFPVVINVDETNPSSEFSLQRATFGAPFGKAQNFVTAKHYLLPLDSVAVAVGSYSLEPTDCR